MLMYGELCSEESFLVRERKFWNLNGSIGAIQISLVNGEVLKSSTKSFDTDSSL